MKHNSITSSNTEFVESELEAGTMNTEYAVKIYEREFLTNPPISFAADDIGQPGEKGKKFSVFSTSDERIVYSKSMYKKNDKTILDDDFDKVEDDEFQENQETETDNIIEEDY